MEPYRMLLSKRETRLYLDKPVPDEVVFKVLEAGRLAGSAKNRQPWEFILVRDRERLAGLSKYGHFASHLPNAAFAVVIVVPDKYVQDRFDAGRARAEHDARSPFPRRRLMPDNAPRRGGRQSLPKDT
jgi:nitroreductase